MDHEQPENPPGPDCGPSLIEHYPPHGFPPYLGLGLLDPETLRLEPGKSVAEYRAGTDLVYRVIGTFDPSEGDTACGAKTADWEINEFFENRLIQRTVGYKSLPQAFFHHISGRLPTENPRLAALFERLTVEFQVAVRIRPQTTYAMFPAGYVYAIRVPVTEKSLENFKAFANSQPDPVNVPPPRFGELQSVAILKLTTTFDVEVERGVAVDVGVPLYRLIETLERLEENGADAGPVHLRPEIIYSHEGDRKYSQVYPGKIARNIVTYTVLPIDDHAPPLEELREKFWADSYEIFTLVREALYASPPESDPLRALEEEEDTSGDN